MARGLTIYDVRRSARRVLAGLAAVLRLPPPLDALEFRQLLAPLAANRDFHAMLRQMQRHPIVVRKIRRALADPALPSTSILEAAELIGLALTSAERCDAATLDWWLLPLLRRSSGRYLPKPALGRFLCVHLAAMNDPGPAVAAFESEISPRSWDDYSNFADLFSMGTWKILRPRLTNPRVLTQLDLFVTGRDREEFWNELCPNQLPHPAQLPRQGRECHDAK